MSHPITGLGYTWLIFIRRLTPSEIDGDWGGVQKEWNAMRSHMVEGDELWQYECSINHQHLLSGTSGIALKRGDKVITHVVTRRVLS